MTTRSDDTIEKRARDYYNVTDDAALASIIDRVARVNSQASFEEVQSLQDRVLALMPDNYKDAETLKKNMDSLVTSYHLCLIRWGNYPSAKEKIDNGLADSVLTTDELERINFGVANALGRFIPEEIVMPYAAALNPLRWLAAAAGMSRFHFLLSKKSCYVIEKQYICKILH